jgi:hypothetical protein
MDFFDFFKIKKYFINMLITLGITSVYIFLRLLFFREINDKKTNFQYI